MTSIVPVTFSVASSMTKILFGHPPMYSVPLPPVSLAARRAGAQRRSDDGESDSTSGSRVPTDCNLTHQTH